MFSTGKTIKNDQESAPRLLELGHFLVFPDNVFHREKTIQNNQNLPASPDFWSWVTIEYVFPNKFFHRKTIHSKQPESPPPTSGAGSLFSMFSLIIFFTWKTIQNDQNIAHPPDFWSWVIFLFVFLNKFFHR